MPPTRFRPGRSRRGLAPLSLALALLWGVPVLAGDKPATTGGADALKALIAKYLPAAQAGKTYEMWVIPKGGAPRPAGLFQSQGGTAMHILSGPVDMASVGAIAVTLEPEAGSSAPTTTPIIVAPVAGP